jgi:hypothetical protein
LPKIKFDMFTYWYYLWHTQKQVQTFTRSKSLLQNLRAE